MIVTIHQPDFAPWLGFFHRWAASDLYVVLDDVQFLRRGWHHRDRIRTKAGLVWLTVPVLKKGRYDQRINEVRMDNGSNWRAKHLGTIAAAYGKCQMFGDVFPRIEKVYAGPHELLIDFNMALLREFADLLGIKVPMAMASDNPSDCSSTDRLVELTALHGGTAYMTGLGSRDYLDEAAFAQKGIEVIWDEYRPAPYQQVHGSFEPGLSVIDYLMNVRNPGASQ